jgi:hypothetical protein
MKIPNTGWAKTNSVSNLAMRMSNIQRTCPKSVNRRDTRSPNQALLSVRVGSSHLSANLQQLRKNATFLRLSPTDAQTRTSFIACIFSHHMTSPFGSGFPKEVTQPLAYLSPFSNKLHAYPTPQLIPRCVSLDLFLGELIPWSLLRHRLQDGHSLFHILAVFISICFASPRIDAHLGLLYSIFLRLRAESKLHIWGYWEARQHWVGKIKVVCFCLFITCL